MKTEQQMKPILFSTPMVQSILAWNKTMTRRIIKPQPLNEVTDIIKLGNEWVSAYPNRKATKPFDYKVKSKYQIGDILWVRETHYRYGKWVKNGLTKSGKQKWMFTPYKGLVNFCYPDNPPPVIERNAYRKIGWYKRPSIFMPKIVARIFLKVTDIRVERLNDMDEWDACSEGIEIGENQYYRNYLTNEFSELTATQSYETLWEKINGFESLNSNPWVWVISFERIESTKIF